MSESVKSQIRREVARIVHRDGLQSAVRQLHMPREQVLRLVAGVPVRQGTYSNAALALGIVPEARA